MRRCKDALTSSVLPAGHCHHWLPGVSVLPAHHWLRDTAPAGHRDHWLHFVCEPIQGDGGGGEAQGRGSQEEGQCRALAISCLPVLLLWGTSTLPGCSGWDATGGLPCTCPWATGLLKSGCNQSDAARDVSLRCPCPACFRELGRQALSICRGWDD